MNTKALRQKILDLAIHGKLVPQDPNDEPASVLLERIKAEKERLIKEGKIKRTKRSKAACDKPHYPYELPEGWAWTTLGDLFVLQAGKNITAKDIFTEQSEQHNYPCFGGNGIRGYVTNSNRNGEFPIIGRQGALCGNINLAIGEFYATEHAVVVERFSDTDLMWAYYTLIELNLNQYATATAQPGIAVNVINDVPIPVPPLKEQCRISKVVKLLFSLVDNIEQRKIDIQAAIKQGKSKILELAIHGKLVPQDPSDEPASELLKRINPKAEITCDNPQYENLPNGWCRCTLKDIGIFESGYAFSSDEYKQNGVPLVRISNITNNGNIDLSSCVYIQNYNNSKFIIHEGDLLIAMSGATTGKMGVYKYKTDALLNQRVGNLKCTEAWFQQYRNYFMLAKSNYILNIAYGGAQPNISAKAILSIEIDLPPINEQHRIVAKIEELFAQLNNIASSL
jgi:type I restriction enzyme, S subunit